MIYKENQGYPEFDQKKAKAYMEKVTGKIRDEILDLYKRWENQEKSFR